MVLDGGDVIGGINTLTGREIAVKIEYPDDHPDFKPVLPYEALILRRLRGLSGIVPFHYAREGREGNVIVMDKLGPNLSELLKVCRGHFSMKTICMLAIQMVGISSRPNIQNMF